MTFISLLGLLLLNAVKNVLYFVVLFDFFKQLLNFINLFSSQYLYYLWDALKARRADIDTLKSHFLLESPLRIQRGRCRTHNEAQRLVYES